MKPFIFTAKKTLVVISIFMGSCAFSQTSYFDQFLDRFGMVSTPFLTDSTCLKINCHPVASRIDVQTAWRFLIRDSTEYGGYYTEASIETYEEATVFQRYRYFFRLKFEPIDTLFFVTYSFQSNAESIHFLAVFSQDGKMLNRERIASFEGDIEPSSFSSSTIFEDMSFRRVTYRNITEDFRNRAWLTERMTEEFVFDRKTNTFSKIEYAVEIMNCLIGNCP